MKLLLNREELVEAVTIAAGVAATRTPKPILQCILLEVFNDYAILSATDLEVGVRLSITRIEVEKTGSVLVPADKLGPIVRECSDETLRIEVADNICHIRGQDSHFQVYAQDAKEFPPVAELEGDCDFEMPVAELRRLSEWTVFAAARENTRYAINGVLWDRSSEGLTMVATDGRRLSKAFQVMAGGVDSINMIVPTKAMGVFARVLGEPESVVGVKFSSNQILLKSACATVCSSLLEGHFPNYQDVVPTDLDKSVEFNTQELLSAVRRAALLTNEESKGVRLSFSDGTLTLSSRAPEQGEAVITMSVNYRGPDMEIGFNPTFLIDILHVVSEDTVRFEFSESNRPGLFRCGDSFLYVVMPVNLS